MSRTKKAASGKTISAGRKDEGRQPISPDRIAHFSSDCVITIDGEPVYGEKDGIGYLLNEKEKAEYRSRRRRGRS